MEHLFWTVFGARGLKAIDPHATVDRAFQAVEEVQTGLQEGLFVIPERIASSDLLLAGLPMSPRLRAAWRDLLDVPDPVVGDTADTTKRALSDAGGGWSAAVEWAVLLRTLLRRPGVLRAVPGCPVGAVTRPDLGAGSRRTGKD